MSNHKSLTVVLTLALAFVASACSGGNPTAPTTPSVVASPTPSATPKPGTPKNETVENITVVNGDSGLPIVNVMVNGVGTNDLGQVPAPSSINVPVTASAGGYLLRETMYNPTTPTIGLWPIDDADGTFVRQLVYVGVEGFGVSEMSRFVGQVFVRLSPELAKDPDVVAAFSEAIAELNEKSGGFAPFALNQDPSIKENLVTVGIGDTGGYGGTTGFLTDKTGRITSATITVRAIEFARVVYLATHELGHAFGLHHTGDTNDVMAITGGPDKFNVREALAMRMMGHRGPGNRFPDNDRPLTAAAMNARKAREFKFNCNF